VNQSANLGFYAGIQSWHPSTSAPPATAAATAAAAAAAATVHLPVKGVSTDVAH
jgi:hypothetical protein